MISILRFNTDLVPTLYRLRVQNKYSKVQESPNTAAAVNSSLQPMAIN